MTQRPTFHRLLNPDDDLFGFKSTRRKFRILTWLLAINLIITWVLVIVVWTR